MTFPSAGAQTYLGQSHFSTIVTFVQATRDSSCLISKRSVWIYLYLEKSEQIMSPNNYFLPQFFSHTDESGRD
jgi:hypothetical protein